MPSEAEVFGTILVVMALITIGIWVWAWCWLMSKAWDRWVEPFLAKRVARRKGWDDDWLVEAKRRRDE